MKKGLILTEKKQHKHQIQLARNFYGTPRIFVWWKCPCKFPNETFETPQEAYYALA